MKKKMNLLSSTESKTATTECLPQEEDLHFHQLADASPDPMLITNLKGEIYHVNPSWEKLTGYSFEEVKGKNPRILNNESTPKIIYKNLWLALRDGKSFSTNEIFDRKKDGTVYQIHSTFYPIRKDNKNIFYVQHLYDITKQKELERQKDAFIGIASHELKTPITSLNLYTQMLEKRLQQHGDIQDLRFVANIKGQSERLINLIDDLLNVSKIDSGKLELHRKDFDMHELVKQVVTNFQYITSTHEISIDGDSIMIVNGDENRIEQVIVNLLTNAIKYSPNANKVVMHLSIDNQNVVTAVEDFGLGIAKEDLPHVFQRFYRTKDKEEGKISGFGLGLHIASEIIKTHNGKIWVNSEKGKGSTFYFSLPLSIIH